MYNSLPTISSGDSGFYNYLNEINKIPSLSEEEEFKLSSTYKKTGDLLAAQKLVTSHLKLVAKIAMSYKGYGLPIVELVSEGNLGLMQAVKKFDPQKGFRLSTYAIWWIKAAIQEYVLRSWSLVKIGTTAAQKKLFFNLGKIKRKIHTLESRKISAADYEFIAKELDVTEKEVREMDLRMNQDYSLDDPISNNEDSISLLEIIPTSEHDQETLLANYEEGKQNTEYLMLAIKELNDREQYIIQERRLSENPMTLEQLSAKYNISKERVRQIEERALEKMKLFIENKKQDN